MRDDSPGPYLGRFAPSPTGPLHFGSLLAATASYLEARRAGGRWQLRIDDIDPPREAPGQREAIPQTLEAFGFEWDGPILYQSQQTERYQAAIEQLKTQQAAYPCACTRKEVKAAAKAGLDGPIYPGSCRQGLPAGREARAIRMSTEKARIEFEDTLQGRIEVDLDAQMGDFIIHRADGFFAYHLAAAVDDGAPEISHVVRGIDLLYSTPRQIHLMQALGLTPPVYMHIPVALAADGQKLSKQTGAQAIDPQYSAQWLHQALQALQQPIPASLRKDRCSAIWDWAMAYWDPTPLQGIGEVSHSVWDPATLR